MRELRPPLRDRTKMPLKPECGLIQRHFDGERMAMPDVANPPRQRLLPRHQRQTARAFGERAVKLEGGSRIAPRGDVGSERPRYAGLTSASSECSRTSGVSAIERPLLRVPGARVSTRRRRFHVAQAIVEAARAPLPELERVGNDAVAAPPRRPRHGSP